MRKTKTVPAAQSKICALYARVSTVDQGTRFSLPSQLKALRDKAEREGFTVREDYIFVDTFSGKVASRPAFDRMNALAKSGAIGAVFAFSVDRFSRRTEDALRLSREYRQHGVRLDFVESYFEDSPAGRFSFTQMCAFAELWAEKLAADTARGRKQALDSGLLDHGKAAYGLKYIPKAQEGGRRFVVDDAPAIVAPDSPAKGVTKAQVIRDIYEWRRAGTTTSAITTRLNERGILSQSGSRWARCSILQILRNPTYKGKHQRMGRVFDVPAIVSEDVWDAVQRINAASKEAHNGRPSKGKYLLRSILWCGKPGCGHRMVSQPKTNRPGYYRCGHIQQNPTRKLCSAPQVSVDSIEAAVWRSVWSVVTEPKLLLELGEAFYRAMAKPTAGENLEHEAAHLKAKRDRIKQMMEDGITPYAEGREKIGACDERIREIEGELQRAGRVFSLPPRHAAEAACRELADPNNEPKEYQGRRAVLEGILDLRMKYYDGDLQIEGKIPVPGASASADVKKNCLRGPNHIDSSFDPIPFTIVAKVA